VTRWWNEAVGWLAEPLPGGVPMLVFLSLLATILIALGWYFWPSWLPWNWGLRWGSRSSTSDRSAKTGRRRFRLGALRWRWRLRWRRRGAKGQPGAIEELADDELPDLPAEVMLLTADQLAAAGRYAEAVRERLRAIVRDLIDRGVIPVSPGWTVTELATFATQARPELAPALQIGINVFSEIWYGLRPAGAEDDAMLRSAANDVKRLLVEPAAATRSGGNG
jgi:hypothetical protein